MEALAKITRPSPEGLFPRGRLFRRLDEALARPVIFITGPPGSGKTCLVTSYLTDRKLPCLWYQVDGGDADLATFFYYMGLAGRKAAPRYKKPLPLFTPEYAFGVPTFTRRYFESLCLRLKTPYVLVFDNYQEIPSESLFHEMIRTGLSALPENILSIIISRSEPPAAFAAMDAGNKLHVIGWNDLKLASDESKGIAKLQEIGPEHKLYHWLHEKADGLAAGVVLLARAVKSQGIDPEASKDLAPGKVFDFFANELFDRLDQPLQNFLLKTALVPKITPGLAEALTGNKAAAKILSNLNRSNIFTEKRTQPEVSYQYHALFREFLITHAASRFPSGEISGLKLETAKLLEASGETEGAAELFMQAGAWGDATRLILHQAPALTAQGRGMTLSGWIEAIPEAIVQNTPYLLFWKGIYHLPFSPPRGREYLEKAFRLFEAGQDAEGVFLAWSGVVTSFVTEWDDFTPLDPWIDWLDKRLSEGSPPPPAVYARVAVGMIWALTYRRPWHPDIRKWAERAMSLTQNHPDPNLRIQACIAVSTYNYFMGEVPEGVLPASEGRRIAHGAGVSPLTLLGMKFIEIILHWLTEAPGASSHLISEVIAIAEKTGVHIYDSMLYSYALCDFLTKGDLTQAGELLGKMETMLKGSQRCALGHYHYVAAWYYFLLNDFPNAAVHADKGVQFPFETGMPFGEANSRILMAYLFQKKGEPRQALEQIEMAREVGRKTKSSLFEWLCGLADAWVAINMGDEASGLNSLRKAMAIGRARGIVNWEGFLPSPMTELCLKALENGIEIEYVRDLIRKRGLVPDRPPYKCEGWPWPLKIFTLGRFEIVRDEKPLQYTVRAPRVPLTLLKAIVAFGSGGVKEDQLVDALWPETDGDTAHQTFKTTLHRLRQLIGDERTIQVREGRVTLDQKYCWVDAHAFEFLLEKAERLWEEGQKADEPSDGGVRLTERALSLYRGTFLGEEAYESWGIAYQERLRSKFVRGVRRLGNHFERSGQWEKAVECYQKGLEADELAEEFYQRLMACYLSWNRRAEAIAVYKRCRKALQSILGIDPSPRTEEILKGLK